jgi:hypothetical protein
MRHHLLERRQHLAAAVGAPPAAAYVREPAFQAFVILRAGFAALPIIAGADKFFHLLANWNLYLAPVVASLVRGHVRGFMDLVGVVEMAAGVLVAVKPRWGSAVVGLWLCGIIVNLLMIPGFYDIALRDFGLAVGALAFFRLSRQFAA